MQTASGTTGAELVIEGLPEFEAVRDFLYQRMRGVREDKHADAPVALLREIRDELRATREAIR